MSSSVFREHIRSSIANESLQAALDANAERRVNGRVAAFASLPDWRERRRRAHAVRAEVIEHLDEYVAQFVRKAGENGFIVHRAAGAAEAVEIILRIAQDAVAGTSSQALVAKSKSMVSEEIELNHALEQHGIRVVETDLGEYIVQLRGEKPAHIITPSVHLRRHEVGQLFEEQLGIAYTEDIPTLTAVARKVLREVFLTANVGISGVNFGVAETGTLCIVTNEGNGRMVTTMPPVHVALMGMERLLPRLEDLPLLLSLLPRSATGQKLSVYTQLIHGPRRSNEVDGAPVRHLVILDNGRSRLRASPLREALYCIRCGACLNACPVFRELGGHAYVGSDGSIAPYPGPIGSVVSPGLLGLEQFGHLAQASSLCGACKDACPVDIDLPRLLTRVRAGGSVRSDSQGIALSPVSKLGLRAYGVIGSSPSLFRAFQLLGALATRLVSPSSAWIRLPAATGWGYSKDFPRVATRPFHKRFQARKAMASQFTEQANLPATAPVTQILTPHALVDRFCLELEALGGKAIRVHETDLYPQLKQLLHDREITRLLAWDQIDGLNMRQLQAEGIAITHEPDPSVIGGITGASLAIAETGTLLLTSGQGQPLSASLLPEVHIAILRPDHIVGSLEEAFKIGTPQ
ncbi:MAG: LUD domain-containing protein, partial [Anaerolineae bacterium]